MSNSQEETKGPASRSPSRVVKVQAKQRILLFWLLVFGVMGREVLCLREPGGTSIGEAVRSLVLI